MLYYKRYKTRFSLIKRIIILLFAFFIAAVVYCEIRISEFSPQYIRESALIRSQKVISTTVENVIKEFDYSYNDIVMVKYSDNDTVQSIETDSGKINLLKSTVSERVQEELSKIHDNELKIPLGIFTNITILSNVGPEIPFTFSLTGSVNSELLSTFESTGLNQSIHHIRLMITASIMTTSLDYSGEIVFTTDYEIAQTVIVGAIPSYYGSMYKTY